MENVKQKIQCVIKKFRFRNEETGWAVAIADAKGFCEPICIIGMFFQLSTGSTINAEGEWLNNKKYGEQFKVDDWEEILPATIYGIKCYLGGSMIPGIGKKTAEKIVDYFGEKTLKVLDETPNLLLKIPGIGKSTVEKLIKGWEENKHIKNVMIFLQGLDISPGYAVRIYKKLGKKCIHMINENPYIITEYIKGIGFKKADAIAANKKIMGNDSRRLKAGILYVLNEVFTKSGSTYAEEEELYATTVKLLNEASKSLKMDGTEITREDIVPILNEMKKDEKINTIFDHVYLPSYFKAETESAKMLLKLAEKELQKKFSEPVNIPWLEKKLGLSYAPEQKEAIQKAAEGKLVVLTGGPGTGKTTTINGIISWFIKNDLNILLAAPTGRAAKRMTEATGMEAKTIHRLLEFDPAGNYFSFKKNEKNKLEGDVLIIDECSMVDINLFYSILLAIPPNMKLILVGDVNQLPSVGPGNVLSDIIKSEKATMVRLKTIFRQAMQSKIVTNAHKICEGKMPDLLVKKNNDFFFVDRESPEEICNTIIQLVSKNIPQYYHYSPDDIQVLCPMIKGVIGAVNLNKELQCVLNPKGEEITYGNTIFRVNDRVMQIRNNYEKCVFNGDMGKITEINKEERRIIVKFDDQTIEYEKEDFSELIHSNATTIHKSQGSEFPVVIIPVSTANTIMLQRNLVYTGVTRAKKLCILVGQRQALYFAVKNNKAQKRNSGLLSMLNPDKFNKTTMTDWSIYYSDKESKDFLYPDVHEMLDKISLAPYRQKFALSEEEKVELSQTKDSILIKKITDAIKNTKKEKTKEKEGWINTVLYACCICCRGCIEKWYGIPENTSLTEKDILYLTQVSMEFIKTSIRKNKKEAA